MNNQITNFYAQKFFKDNPDGFAPKKKAAKKNFSAEVKNAISDMFDGIDLAGNNLNKQNFKLSDNTYMPVGLTLKNDVAQKAAQSMKIPGISNFNITSGKAPTSWKRDVMGAYIAGVLSVEKYMCASHNYSKLATAVLASPDVQDRKVCSLNDVAIGAQSCITGVRTPNSSDDYQNKIRIAYFKGAQASKELADAVKSYLDKSNKSGLAQVSQEKIAANYSRRNYGLGNAVAGGVSKVGTVIGNVNKALVPNAKCSLDNSIEFNKIISDYLTNIVNTHGNDPKVCTQLINNAKKEILNVLDGCKKTMHVLGKNFSRKDAARIRMYAKHRNYNLASNMQAIVNQSKAIGNSALTAAKSGTSAAISAAENAFTAVNGTIRGIFSGDILPKVSDTVEKIRLSCGGDTKYCDQMIDMLKKEVIHNCDVAEKAVKLTAKTAKRSLA